MEKGDVSSELGFVPLWILQIMERLYSAGYRVWLVGGALRDYRLGINPKDWDLATQAEPEEVMKLFPRVIPVGLQHGTVRIHTEHDDVEVTTYTSSETDGILRDLSRRDFTVNALALSFPDGRWLDPYGGQKDLREKKLRAVGDAHARFQEDPLRTLRAGRFMSTHGFRIIRDTFDALKEESHGLDRTAQERIREEMSKLLLGNHVLDAFERMRRGGVLQRVLPELVEGYRKKQNLFHKYDIYGHILQTVHHSPARLRVRFAALFHDIAKPRVRKRIGGVFRFYGHAAESALLAEEVMHRWRMPHREMETIQCLVENHMLMGSEKWTDAAVRRLIARVGEELLDDLFDLARADHLSHAESEGSLEELDRLRLRVREQLSRKPPLKPKDLAVNGRDVMEVLGLRPGPLVGEVLHRLHQEILEHPERNDREFLMERIKEAGDQTTL